MNKKRIFGGPILSMIFLAGFVYIVSGMGLVTENLLINQPKNVYLGSLSNSITVVENKDPGQSFNFAPGMPQLNVQAQSAISVLIDPLQSKKNNKIILDINVRRKLPIASITKLITALVVIENYNLGDQIIISEKAGHQTVEPDQLKIGEQFYVNDLLYTMLIGSDNAASFALSEGTDGYPGNDKFLNLMNAKAVEIGMADTFFTNPTGLELENFSTTYDLYILAEYLLKNYPSILDITTINHFDLYSVDEKILHKIKNTNDLLNNQFNLTSRIIGGKTGYTDSAGGCLLLIVKAISGDGYLVNVILNSADKFGEMEKIISWADLNYQW